MKITNVSKSITYYVEVYDPESVWTEYRTTASGSHWEVAMGDSWESVNFNEEDKLRKLFLDYMNK